jgi:hypothetical protein
MWGFRANDPTYKNLSSSGIFAVAYMGAKHIKIKNNVVFDGTGGIIIADRYDAEHGSEDVEVIGNLLYELGKKSRGKGTTVPILISQSLNDVIKDNVIINSEDKWSNIWSNKNLYFGNNTIINPGKTNVLMGQYSPAGMSTNKIFETAVQARYTENYSFKTDKFTNNPKVIILKNAVKAY